MSNELDLAPHEELDEIDRRTNEDGTVEVELLEWEKQQKLDRVGVSYLTPTGKVKTESMEWPEANDPSYKFIRLIEQTPYTLRTAESINEDGVMLDANPDTWELQLPEEQSLTDKIPEPERGFELEVAKLLFYPITLLALLRNLMEKDMEVTGFRREEYSSTYLEDDAHLHNHITALKATIYTLLWVFIIAIIIL